MSMMVSFVLSFFPRDVLDEILNLIESVSEDFPSYSSLILLNNQYIMKNNMCKKKDRIINALLLFKHYNQILTRIFLQVRVGR